MRYLASSVAPVRGATYFSLPPQRKVGKRKRLTPPVLDLCPRAPNVPTLHTATHRLACVANAPSVRLTRFTRPRHSTSCQTVRRRPGGKLCVGPRCSTRFTPDWVAGLVFLVRALSCAVRQPTHSLPPGRHIPFAAACASTGVRSR